MIKILKKISGTETALIALLALLFMVWPVPHTATARDSLLLLGLLAAGVWCYRAGAPVPWWRELRPAMFLFAAFIAWVLFVAIVVSSETAWSLSETSSQWGRAFVALATGACAAVVLRAGPGAPWPFLILLLPLLIHICAVDVSTTLRWDDGDMGYRRVAGLTEEVDKASYLSNMLLALLMAEALARVVWRRKFLPGSHWLLGAVTIATAVTLYAEGARNAVAVAAVMLACWFALWLSATRGRAKNSWKRSLVTGAAVVSVIGVLILAFSTNPGNGLGMRRTLETIPIAFDTVGHKTWLDEGKYPRPTLSDGSNVDFSAYLRVAWFKEGLILTSEHPFGVGFGRNAFGHGILAKYGESKSHSHSSFIDILVGVGIPGMALWFLFLGSLAWVGLKGFQKSGNTYGLALFFVVVDFGTRMMIDSNVRDHMLQMFMFAAGLLAVAATRPATPPVLPASANPDRR